MIQIILSNDEVETLISILREAPVGLHDKATVNLAGLEFRVLRLQNSIGFSGADWMVHEVVPSSPNYDPMVNRFYFKGDEAALRRELMLAKMVTR